jgi:Pyridoxamine 5'-phosphate oxidase
MASWGEFAAAEPEMAAFGKKLFLQYGLGLAFIATVSAKGEPRLHPITIALTNDQLYAFIVPGPKQNDLERDGRYAMHALQPENIEDEFMVAGRAHRADTPEERAKALTGYHQDHAAPDHRLVRFDLERALMATYDFRGQWPPAYRRWRAPRPAA